MIIVWPDSSSEGMFNGIVYRKNAGDIDLDKAE